VNVPEFLKKIWFETSVGEPELRAKEPKYCLLHPQFIISAPTPAPFFFYQRLKIFFLIMVAE
jgi:hypothetical protein